MGLRAITPALFGRAMLRAVSDSVHAVQFYETDPFLIETLAAYVGGAIRGDEAAIVIASREHLDQLRPRLTAYGAALESAELAGRVQLLDAHTTLAQITPGGERIDRALFNAVIGAAIARARDGAPSRAIRAFGEMVAMLWADGRADVALELEDAWSDLIRRTNIALICAYPVSVFSEADRTSGLIEAVRSAHRPIQHAS